MSKLYRTSKGDMLDMDMLRLQNEETIAIGNAGVNARGDELGPGGTVMRTRAQVMAEYHKLNSDLVDDTPMDATPQPPAQNIINRTPMVDIIEQEQAPASTARPRGQLADSIANSLANEQQIKQEPMQIPPELLRNRGGNNGPSRM